MAVADSISLDSLIQGEHLPVDFRDVVEEIHRPIATQIAAWHAGKPCLLGINGAQGTGKSTLSLFLKFLLETEHHLPTAILSIDDLYLPRSERLELSRQVHPLFLTRGVPGTHDIPLGMRTIDALMGAEASSCTLLPKFDKARDDRAPASEWPEFHGRPQVVIFEGWCVGATPQNDQDLLEPINQLERQEDADGIWRRNLNEVLGNAYRPLFDRIDRLLFLRAPDMECIRRWRGRQEQKLREKIAATGQSDTRVMSEVELERFIQHYERLTLHQWRDMPQRADLVIELDECQCAKHVYGKCATS